MHYVKLKLFLFVFLSVCCSERGSCCSGVLHVHCRVWRSPHCWWTKYVGTSCPETEIRNLLSSKTSPRLLFQPDLQIHGTQTASYRCVLREYGGVRFVCRLSTKLAERRMIGTGCALARRGCILGGMCR